MTESWRLRSAKKHRDACSNDYHIPTLPSLLVHVSQASGPRCLIVSRLSSSLEVDDCDPSWKFWRAVMLASKEQGESETTAEIPHILDERPELERVQVLCSTFAEDVLPLYSILASSWRHYSQSSDRRESMTMAERKRYRHGESCEECAQHKLLMCQCLCSFRVFTVETRPCDV